MGLLGDIADFGKGVIENNVKWTERAAKVGEFIARNTVGAQLEQVAHLGGQIIDLSQKAAEFFESEIGRRLVRAAQSPILAAGQHAIEVMKHSTGVGDPETGQRFAAGAEKMGAAGQVLASAFPDDSWNSGGASAYTGRNTEQVGRVQTMVGLDNMVAGVLTKEAGQISAARDSLDGHSDWLGAMSLLSTSAGIIPGFGQAARMTAEIAMVAKAVGESTGDLNTLRGHLGENAAVLQTAASQYETLADGAVPTGAEFAPPVGDPQGAPGAAPSGGTPSGGGSPSGGGGSPSGGGGGGTPSGGGAPTPSSTPSMPVSMPSGGSPSSDAAGDAAGAMGGILGSLMSPLSGMLGGVMQAAGQAAQAATQAATQAAQVASQAAGQGSGAGAAQLDKASGDAGVDTGDVADADAEDDKDRDDDRDGKDEDGKDEDGKDEDDKDGDTEGAGPDPDQVDDPPAAESPGQDAEEMGAGPDGEAAKTLPPDLEVVATGGNAAGPAPVHAGTDFEQGQLHMAAAARLDRGVPGSAAVIDR